MESTLGEAKAESRLRQLGWAPGGNFAAQNMGIGHISTFCTALHFLCAVKPPKQAVCGALRGIRRSKLGQGPVLGVGRPCPSSEHSRNNPNCTFQTPVKSIVFLWPSPKKVTAVKAMGPCGIRGLLAGQAWQRVVATVVYVKISSTRDFRLRR